MDNELVSICIPAYRAEAFLEDTLRSALKQDWPNFEILVSVDPADDRTEEIVRDYQEARLVRGIIQPTRLGWVHNSNAVLKSSSAKFVMLLPHDDLLEPQYVSSCMAALEANRKSVLAFSDISLFGDAEGILTEPSVTGSNLERITNYLRFHFNAVAFRGVFSRCRARRHYVPTFAIGGFAADTLWVFKMAIQGDIISVPGNLYHKRMLQGSAHQSWLSARTEEIEQMWVVHCLEVIFVLASLRPNLLFNSQIRLALRSRILREHVLFKGTRDLPSVLRSGPMLRQLLGIYLQVKRQQPHYSWLEE